MLERTKRFFLKRYDSEKPIVRKRIASLCVVLSALLAGSLVLVILIADKPVLRVALVTMVAVSLGLLALIRAGYAKQATVSATVLLSLLLASMVFLQPYKEGSELYSVVAYEAMMLIVAGLIATHPLQLVEILAAGVLAVSLDFFGRVVPGGGEADNFLNFLICLGLLGISGVASSAIMSRNKLLLDMAEGEAEKNSEQVRELEAVILSSKDALGMGLAVKESSEKTHALILQLQETLVSAKRDMERLAEKTRLIGSSNSEIASSAKIVQDRVADQTAIVTESSSSIEQMTSSIRSISDITEARRSSMAQLKKTTGTGVQEMARAAEAGGADAVSAINTLVGMAIDVRRKKACLSRGTGGLSGPAVRPVGVACVYRASRAAKIPVIGLGGISCADDALQYLLAGARAIQIGTANFVDPRCAAETLEGIEAWMEREGVERVEDIGRLLEA